MKSALQSAPLLPVQPLLEDGTVQIETIETPWGGTFRTVIRWTCACGSFGTSKAGTPRDGVLRGVAYHVSTSRAHAAWLKDREVRGGQ